MTKKDKKYIYICDDHTLFAESLKAFFSFHHQYQVIGYSSNVMQAYDEIIKLHPDIVLIDYQLKTSNGLELLKKIKRSNLTTACFMLTMKNDPEIKTESKKDGASGYLLKEISGDEMIKVFDNFITNHSNTFYDFTEHFDYTINTDSSSILTKRELEIAKLVCKGYSSNQISKELNLSVLTISTHRKHILKKLNVRNPIELLYKLQ
jgi:DNA-binding NarL/FixJ family response regulator